MAVKASASVTLSKIVDVQSTARYYQRASSTSSTPAKPTTYPPSADWLTTEPLITDEPLTISARTYHMTTGDEYTGTPKYIDYTETTRRGLCVKFTPTSSLTGVKFTFQPTSRWAVGSLSWIWVLNVSTADRSGSVSSGVLYSESSATPYARNYTPFTTSLMADITYNFVANTDYYIWVLVDANSHAHYGSIKHSDDINVLGHSQNAGSTAAAYTVEATVFTDGTFSYSDVSLMSSYDSAKSAGKVATNFLDSQSGTGIIVGDMTAQTLGKNVLIGDSSVDIRDGSTVLASFGANGIEFDQAATFKADGILVDNNDAYSYLGQNKVLWSSNTGYWMRANQSITLSDNISRQMNGVVFAWCKYTNGAPTNSHWKYFFVPKSHVINRGGDGVMMSDPYMGIMKYLYISNGNVSGVAENEQSGTQNGIAYNNAGYVLRYVIGV